MFTKAREIAAGAVQAVGDKVGAVAGGVAATATVAAIGAKTGGVGAITGAMLVPAVSATVQSMTAKVTAALSGSILAGAKNPLNVSFTTSDTSNQALASHKKGVTVQVI